MPGQKYHWSPGESQDINREKKGSQNSPKKKSGEREDRKANAHQFRHLDYIFREEGNRQRAR